MLINRGLRGSAMGVVDALTAAPRRRFRLNGGVEVGDTAELTVFDLHAREVIDPKNFLSMGRATPFEGWPVHAACRLTIRGENVAYNALEGGRACFSR